MVKYISKNELEKYLKCMTILDIVMLSEDEAWLRHMSYYKDENMCVYTMDNGSGDELVVIFGEQGVLIKGFDHENELNQFAADEWDDEFFARIYKGLPEDFAEFLDDEAKENTTFCMWCIDDSDMWIQNEIEDNDGGKEYLLGYVRSTPEEWCDWAKDYFETDIALEVVEKIYNGEKITEEDVLKMNPERDVKEVFAEIEEKFYLTSLVK